MDDSIGQRHVVASELNVSGVPIALKCSDLLRWRLHGTDDQGCSYSISMDIVPSLVRNLGTTGGLYAVEFIFSNDSSYSSFVINNLERGGVVKNGSLLCTLCGEVLSFSKVTTGSTHSSSSSSTWQLCISAGGLLTVVEGPRRFFYNSSLFKSVVNLFEFIQTDTAQHLGRPTLVMAYVSLLQISHSNNGVRVRSPA